MEKDLQKGVLAVLFESTSMQTNISFKVGRQLYVNKIGINCTNKIRNSEYLYLSAWVSLSSLNSAWKLQLKDVFVIFILREIKSSTKITFINIQNEF